jgi:D-alanyl-D-alanine carboxypeptidase
MKTKKMLQILFPLGGIISLFFVPWVLIKAWLIPLPDYVQEQVDQALDYHFEGIIVYVDQSAQAPQFYAAGWHNREDKIPADPQALFKIASISKLYNAVAIAKLVHSERLSLDKTLAYYLPELKGRIENVESISLGMMVQHRSGIPNITDNPSFWTDPPSSREEALDRALDLPANFAPDKDYQYSNTNYLLLEMIIERVLGYPSFQYIKEEVLEPLNLHNTFASLKDVDLDRLMSGYYVGVEEDIKSADYGSMIASAKDLGIFIRALNDGSLFNAGEQEIYSSIYVYNHTGLIPGYQSIAEYHPEIDAVIIQFTNTTDFDGYHWSLSEIVYNRIVKIVKKK